jgi:hypothetical protein
MKKAIALLSVLYISSVINLFAQDSITEISRNEQKTDTIGLTEGEAYKMLFENQIHSNDAILKTIFYALAGLATAIISVFAGNWWFNEKKVKDVSKGINLQITQGKNEALSEIREKINSMSQQNTSEINNTFAVLKKDTNLYMNDITSKFSEFSEKIRDDIKFDNKAQVQVFEERLKNYSDNLSMQINTLEKRVNTQTDGMKQAISSLEYSMDEKLKNEVEKINSNFIFDSRNMKISLHYNSALIAELNNSFNVAFREYLEIALLQIESSPGLMEFILPSIINALRKANVIWIDEAEKLKELLKKVSGLDEIKSSILERLTTIKILTYS